MGGSLSLSSTLLPSRMRMTRPISTATSMATMRGCRKHWQKDIRIPERLILPATNTSDVYMHEIRRCVVSNATAAHRERRITNFSRGYSRYANIDRHGLHVQAMQGHAVPVSPQVFVRSRSSVSTDDLNFAIRASQAHHQIM